MKEYTEQKRKELFSDPEFVENFIKLEEVCRDIEAGKFAICNPIDHWDTTGLKIVSRPSLVERFIKSIKY